MQEPDRELPDQTVPDQAATEKPAEPTRRDLLAGGAAVAAGIALTHLVPARAGAQEAAATPPTVQPSSTMPVKLNINGREIAADLEPRTSLLDALREHLDMTGTKKGCDHGQCGACTVLIEGRRVLSCLSLAVMHQGKHITTIEGLATGDQLHPVQQAFIDHDAFQCGYCTPGQICSAVGLINEGRCKNDQDIRVEMSGNICRCGAYPNIVDAVRTALSKPA